MDGTLTLAQQGFDDRIALLNQRIEDFDRRLDNKRIRLQNQFNAMELALASLQAQSTALLSLNASTILAQSIGR